MNGSTAEISWMEIKEKNPDFISIVAPYDECRSWKDKLFRDRITDPEKQIIEVNYMSEDLLSPVTLQLSGWRVWYSENDFSEEDKSILQGIIKDMYQWFYDNYEPMPYSIPVDEEEEIQEEE